MCFFATLKFDNRLLLNRRFKFGPILIQRILRCLDLSTREIMRPDILCVRVMRPEPVFCVLCTVRRQYGCQCRAPSMHCRAPSMHCQVPRGANVGCLGPKNTICFANESLILFTYLFKSKTH